MDYQYEDSLREMQAIDKNSDNFSSAPLGQVFDIAIGCDHAGFKLKKSLKDFLSQTFPLLTIYDVGTNNEEAVDYPDLGAKVAELVSYERAKRGILICGSGVGMSIVANKYPRVRAALCLEEGDVALSRRHNDANILVLAGRKTPSEQAQTMVSIWLRTDFEGGRHSQRLAKITAIEQHLLSEC